MITKFKVLWAWFGKNDAPNKPTHIDTFNVEVRTHRDDVYGKNHSSVDLHEVTVKSGDNEEGTKEHWRLTDEPLMTISSNGNGYDVTRHSWGNSDSSIWKMKLNYADAQYLGIALKAINDANNEARGCRDLSYKFGKRPLVDVLKTILPNPKPVEMPNMVGIAEQIEKTMFAPSSLRKVGDITQDMEPLLQELLFDHDMQWGEVLNLIRGYMEIHAPSQQEEYTSGGNPVFKYGPKDDE